MTRLLIVIETHAGLASHSREMLHAGRLLARPGNKGAGEGSLADLSLRLAGYRDRRPDAFVWVEPDEDVRRVLHGITTPRLARAACNHLRSWIPCPGCLPGLRLQAFFREIDTAKLKQSAPGGCTACGDTGRAPARWTWDAVLKLKPADDAEALARTLLLMAWSWNSQMEGFADQKQGTRPCGITVKQDERVRIETLVARVQRHAAIDWPAVVILDYHGTDIINVDVALTARGLPSVFDADVLMVSDPPYEKTTPYAVGGDVHPLLETHEEWESCVGAHILYHEARRIDGYAYAEELTHLREGQHHNFRRPDVGEWIMSNRPFVELES